MENTHSTVVYTFFLHIPFREKVEGEGLRGEKKNQSLLKYVTISMHVNLNGRPLVFFSSLLHRFPFGITYALIICLAVFSPRAQVLFSGHISPLEMKH